ncbi:alpha/beta hydrolase [Aeromicrobium sp. IC_218]|uniref:alpha/beta hydrolase n=1 Tax=Aeromicrobium sp. IC_218 TaxID=2545468 RepID=UPI0013F488F1|nr:alpha/beta hydrolase [Aeromicrobium sp. IC_218]
MERAGFSTHDNVVDLFLATARAGAITASYLLRSGALAAATTPAVQVGYAIDVLWGDHEPSTLTAESESVRWLDHCLITLAAFNPRSNADSPSSRVTEVGLFEGLLGAAGSAAFDARRLQQAGRDLAEQADYDSGQLARRAQATWSAIEDLNSTQTALGDLAIAQLAGSTLDATKLGVFGETIRALAAPAAAWHEREVPPPSSGAATVRDEIGGSLVHSAGPIRVAQRFELDDVPESDDTDGVTRIWYGTDRAPIQGDPRRGFANRPSKTGEVYYGQCLVSIPQSHRFGEIETPLWDRLVRRLGSGRLRLESIDPVDSADDFAASIDSAIDGVNEGDRTATVFVHGYNTTFEAAAIRAAQIGFDLRVSGVTALFSWPSAAKWRMYPHDADNVENSKPALTQFLDTLLTKTSLTRVNFIVHSMGNRLVARTLESVAPLFQAKGVKLGAIILAAPDINVDTFKQLANVYPLLSLSTTMYVSEADKALALSHRLVWNSPRAGFTPPITVVPGVHTIEATDVDVSWLGHGYYAAAAPVLYDILQVLRGDTDPAKRPRLRLANSPDGNYWQLTP